jgi:hypothetical protein
MTRDDVLQELDRAVHLVLAGKGDEADAAASWCRETARTLGDRDLVVNCLQFLCGLAMRPGFDPQKRISLAQELASELPAPETLFQLAEAYRIAGRQADSTGAMRHAQALLDEEEGRTPPASRDAGH